MAGIVSFGAYIPIYRMSRSILNNVWGSSPGTQERAVAGPDEDSLTMATEAVIDCLSGRERKSVDGMYFASTTPPFREKQCASIIAGATDLREQIKTADFANSIRGGTCALNAALDAVEAGSAKQFMVAASDSRLAAPNTEREIVYGDGAAAFLVGNADLAVEIEAKSSNTSAFIDTWRAETDPYPRNWEERFVLDEGYLKLFSQAISAFLKQCGLKMKDFTKVVFQGPDARSHARLATLIGADPKTQVQNPMFGQLGDTGAALSLMMLVAALEAAKPGDRILFASYGDGADVYVLKVTGEIEKLKDKRGIKKHLASKMMLPNYGKYLQYREMMKWEVDLRPPRRTALTTLWRERKSLLGLYGHKCKSCGGIQYPQRRVCQYCMAKDNFEDIRLSDKTGKLFTFSLDERALEIDLPKVLSVIDIDGGGRFYTALTDRDPSNIDVGMPVEFTFRKVHDGSGIHNYFWKARPIRC